MSGASATSQPPKRQRWLLVALGLVLALIGVFLALPAPIDPAAYQPPAP
ncbi:MAG: hypothetical protein HC897_03445, partial [Thermoanaerobaculia bacterium]|nr:hypothetical protein [Thermoanaerobaculia bacterium]